ncbi:MAG: 6-oxocyclohex-1-ene-1-carbonyl-CoA hydratase [Candidatus Wallbacteria bacterium]|nr:6-oxocyclohex-1-ene-1-carbonyl-CoA hydratase [Candidatus Wallbacteria bacterium]
MDTPLKNHDRQVLSELHQVHYELRAARRLDGREAPGLHNAWIVLDNPAQLNSYTTEMVKRVIGALERASNDRSVVAVVITGSGDKAFCTGGNTAEYSEYYSGNPQEYRQYMRLFNDMVTAVLLCDKPVINRVNGMRIAGGQEIGLACDFSIAQDLARFGQAGPKHGSAPDGGSTDMLDLYVDFAAAAESLTLCPHWSAHKALRLGMINDLVPGLKVDGKWVPNPLVITDRTLDAWGRPCLGEPLEGEALVHNKQLFKKGSVDLTLLDEAVEKLCSRLLETMPDCLYKTLTSLRKKKLAPWYASSETNRAWLSLNMMTEARAGFRAFHRGKGTDREVDFGKLRQRLAEGRPWDDEMLEAISPGYERK